MEKGSESRIAMKIDAKAKKAANKRKKARRKYGMPDGSKATESQQDIGEDGDEESLGEGVGEHSEIDSPKRE